MRGAKGHLPPIKRGPRGQATAGTGDWHVAIQKIPLKQPEPGYQPWSPEFSGAVFTPTSVKLLFK